MNGSETQQNLTNVGFRPSTQPTLIALNEAIALVKLLISQRFGEASEEISSQIEGLIFSP
ncbi:MAG: hypothetical protein F6K39_01575 [Okeania sp. SIO3B3]|nr:hypothetical protein [Okeania sp. SIO3B3]